MCHDIVPDLLVRTGPRKVHLETSLHAAYHVILEYPLPDGEDPSSAAPKQTGMLMPPKPTKPSGINSSCWIHRSRAPTTRWAPAPRTGLCASWAPALPLAPLEAAAHLASAAVVILS